MDFDKRRSETVQAFQAFAAYRDLGADRSLDRAAALVGKSGRLLRHWSVLHDWSARTHAYDVHVDQLQQQTQVKERRAMLVRHANAAVALQTTALRALKDIEPGDLTTADVARYIDLAVRIERLARGVSEDDQDGLKAPYLALWARLGGAVTNAA